MILNRRGQEEMVGFVLVVLIVAVIFLVFLGIFVRQGDDFSEQKSVEVQQFLQGAMEHTTECAISYEPDYSDLGALIGECGNGLKCISNRTACDVLNETFVEVLDLGWNVGPERPIKGYVLNASYTSDEEEIYGVSKGVCGGRVRGSNIPLSGGISVSMRVCF